MHSSLVFNTHTREYYDMTCSHMNEYMCDMMHSHVRRDSDEGCAGMSWSLVCNTHIHEFECDMTCARMNEYTCLYALAFAIQYTYIRMSVT